MQDLAPSPLQQETKMVAITQEPTTADLIVKAYENGHRASGMKAEEGHRPHMGASLIGKACERAIWYTWRWAGKEVFDGRMLRLFETGHMAEPRIVSDLRATGAEVFDTQPGTGKQFRVSAYAGHFGGSMDGCARGLVEAPKTWHVCEFKTHSQKSFDKLVKEMVQKAKPQHFDQMQVYMGLTKMDRAIYVAVNKNTDAVYVERVHFDKARFDVLMERAGRLINAKAPPTRISEDPSWFECKFCSFKDICHGDQTPEVNCRTCAHSTPDMAGTDGAWRCAATENMEIDLGVQRIGCGSHRYIPIFLERTAKPVDYHNGDVVYETADGGRFANGQGSASFSSQQIRECGGKTLLPEAAHVKAQVPTARIVA